MLSLIYTSKYCKLFTNLYLFKCVQFLSQVFPFKPFSSGFNFTSFFLIFTIFISLLSIIFNFSIFFTLDLILVNSLNLFFSLCLTAAYFRAAFSFYPVFWLSALAPSVPVLSGLQCLLELYGAVPTIEKSKNYKIFWKIINYFIY